MNRKDELPLSLRAAYHGLHRRSDKQFAAHGITADQFVLLATLARKDALTQRELAARMPSDPSTVRAMLVLLEKRGLISRNTHQSDGRAKTVALTKVGRQTFQEAWDGSQHIRDEMVASLSARDVATLITLLRRLESSLADASLQTAVTSKDHET